MNLKEKEIVSILGGKTKNNKKGVVVPILIIALMTVAFISPFASFVVGVDKGESSTISSTTAVSTTVTTSIKTSTTKNHTTKLEFTKATEFEKHTTEKVVNVNPTKQVTTKPRGTTHATEHQTTAPTTTQKAEQPTKQVTTSKHIEPVAKVETSSKPTTTKTSTTICNEKTTQKPATATPTTKDIIPEIEAMPDNNGDFVVVNYTAYPCDGKFSMKVSNGADVVRIRDYYIYPVKAGKATVDVLYTYGDKVARDTLSVIVGINWSDTYETEVKQETNELNIQVSERREYQLYRYLCDTCHYRDCYTETKNTCCKDSYPQGTCKGKFTVLETKWFSDIDPQILTYHSFSGIKSVLLDDGSEWYWREGNPLNVTRTIYEYKTGSYCIESITQ